MSIEVERAKLGRRPVSIVELDMDSCSLSFGTGLCAATGEPCYNTRGTCKDVVNYTKTITTYSFIDQSANIPIGQSLIPCVKSVSYSPTKLTLNDGLGYRSKASVTLQDFKHHDKGVDPYVSSRTHDTSSGTYFLKFFARNKYYNGRTIRIKTGYLEDASINYVTDEGVVVTDEGEDVFIYNDKYHSSNFKTREYIIDKINITAEGIVQITGIDVLKKIDNKRSQCPAPSEGNLSADITDSQTTLTLIPSGIG